MIRRGWIAAEEGISENNRRAKFYRLTPKGRKQLAVETTKWEKLARAIAEILRPAAARGVAEEGAALGCGEGGGGAVAEAVGEAEGWGEGGGSVGKPLEGGAEAAGSGASAASAPASVRGGEAGIGAAGDETN